jgi:hypothetical protein
MPSVYVTPTTPTAAITDLTAATTLAAADAFLVTQSGTSKQIPFSLIQSMVEIPLVTLSASHSIAAGEGKFAVDGSGGSVTITLPDLTSWAGPAIVLVNAGPSGTFTIVPAGADNIRDPSSGSSVTTLTSVAVAKSMIFEKVIIGGSGVTAWYVR